MKFTKSPLAGYVGGKSNMLEHIIPLIDTRQYHIFCEPFAGSAAVFFAMEIKNGSIYVINDMNAMVINFYRVAKTKGAELDAMLDERGLVSREYHNIAGRYGRTRSVRRPTWNGHGRWHICWLPGGAPHWAQHIPPAPAAPIRLKSKTKIISRLAEKLAEISIENLDAIECISRYDTEASLFYLDPPYVGTDQFHYEGYSQEDFDKLKELLVTLKGKFILSHYYNDELAAWATAHNFRQKRILKRLSLNTRGEGDTRREELLIYNFESGRSLL